MHNRVVAYLVAFSAAALAVGLRALLDPWLGSQAPYILGVVAALIVASYYGSRPALAALTLSMVAGAYWFVPPYHSVWVATIDFQVGAAAHFAVGIAGILLMEARRLAERRVVTAACSARTEAAMWQHALEREATDRRHFESESASLHAHLDERVRERSAAAEHRVEEIAQVNAKLEHEVALRRQIADNLRTRAEEQLRLLGNAVEQETSSVIIAAANGSAREQRIVFVNRAFVDMTGHRRADVFGKTLEEVGVLPASATVPAGMWELLDRGDSFAGETVCRRQDGSELIIEWHATPIRDAQGRVTHFVHLQRDVTERHKTDERLREQATLLDQARDAILVENLDGRIAFWNRGAETLYGWTAEESIGGVRPHPVTSDAAGTLAEANRAIVESGGWTGELRQLTKSGKEITVDSRITLLRDEQGRPKARLIINTDITEKRTLEAQLFRAQRLESIGVLAGGIAHDLNNVLTPIVIAVDLLGDRLSDAADHDVLMMIKKSAERGADLIRQILAFARGAEGQRQSTQLRHVVQELVRLIEQTFPKSITIHDAVPKDLWLVSAETTKIHQVLMNLCVNARDAMPNGGHLRITGENRQVPAGSAQGLSAAPPGPYVVLTVTDDGEGIPPAILDRVFDPFFTTKEPGKGTGLGLSTVLGIVKSHGGFLHVDSTVGVGTSFQIHLPALVAEKCKTTKSPVTATKCGRGELILVVDDEPVILELSRMILEMRGYRVLTAGNGVEGLRVFKQHSGEVQAVLTDMAMPGMDGAALVKALRKIDANVAIVSISGYLNERAPSAGPHGVNRFLTKPYSHESLMTILDELLHERK